MTWLSRCPHTGTSLSSRLREALRDAQLIGASQGGAYPECGLVTTSAVGLPADAELFVGQIPTGVFVPDIPITTFFPTGPLGTSAQLDERNATYWRASLYQVADAIRTGTITPDVSVIKVTTPRDGHRSVAFHADYSIPLFHASRGVVLEECSTAPWLGPHIPAEAPHILDVVRGCEGPIEHTKRPAPEPTRIEIARSVANLIPHGATIQLGLGRWTNAVAAEVSKRQDVRFHTGFVGPWLVDLLDGRPDNQADITTASIADDEGVVELAARLHELARLRIEPATITHHPDILRALQPFVAINTAWEVDLEGQANTEYLADGHKTRRSGVAGLWDFAPAAASQQNGLSIVALPARAGDRSRIVPRLPAPHISLASDSIDVVVTEHGVADLRGLSPAERQRAMIDVASPFDRPGLLEAVGG